jgi:hypothetical protein
MSLFFFLHGHLKVLLNFVCYAQVSVCKQLKSVSEIWNFSLIFTWMFQSSILLIGAFINWKWKVWNATSETLSTLSSWICHFTISVPLQTIIWNEMWNRFWVLFFLLTWHFGCVMCWTSCYEYNDWGQCLQVAKACRWFRFISSPACQFIRWIEIYMFECRRTKILDNVLHQPPSTNRVATSHSLWCSKHCSRYRYKQRIISVNNAEEIFKILTIIC